ncbi:MAG: glycosyltransferase family 4 protein [Desulfosporosinus sp.]
MHICMLTTTHELRDDRIYYKEAISLKNDGFEVTILGTGQVQDEIVNGIRLLSIPRARGIQGRIQVLSHLVDVAAAISCDAYHFHEPELLWAGKKLKKRTGRFVVFDAHEHYPDMMLNTTKLPKLLKPLAAWGMDRWERHYVPLMDHIITADDNIEQRYLEMNPQVTTIFNYPISDLFYKAKPDPELEARYTGRDLLIYEGGIARVRGPLELLAALKDVQKTHPRVKMLFVGPFTDAQCKVDMEKYIARRHLEEWVELVGNVEHTKIPAYVLASKVGLVTLLPVPKFYKNIPIKQFEYMACGVPIVGSFLPPIQSYVENAQCGYIVNPTRPDEIAAAIRQLLDHPEEATEMGQRGRRMVASTWNWENMGEKLVSLYREHLKG